MPFTPMKDTYFSELLHELTNLDLDHSQFDSSGNYIDCENYNGEYIRASRYSQFNGKYDDKLNYGNYINQINEQSLTELIFLDVAECKNTLKRLAIIGERFDKAYTIFSKHYHLFSEGNFSNFDFENDFFYLFNIPRKDGMWFTNGNFTEPLKVSHEFFMDLQDALMYKHGAILWLTYHLRDVYGLPQPEGTKTPAETDNPNPDKPAIQKGFDAYLVEEHRAKITPYLVDNYAAQEPGVYGFMLYALVDSGCMSLISLNGNQSALHRAMQITFGDTGTRQALNTAIRRLDSKEISDVDRREVAVHKKRIDTFLRPAHIC